ncbi:MAG TPA: MauE/DoxX family redox-associated membrane protein [Actinomycetota bacterium]|nr:MauE/DoxX family redox-associated membrane protein [Actinomycetota bacterium]
MIEVVSLAARFALAQVFLLAGLSKASAPERFAQTLGTYHVLPERWARPVALWLPRIEVTSGLLLALGLAQALFAGAVFLLLVAFTGAILVNLVRGVEMECGCFGVGRGGRIGPPSIARNIILIAAAIVVAKWPTSVLAIDLPSRVEGSLRTAEGLAVVFSTTIAMTLILLLQEALQLRRTVAAVGERTRGDTS